MDNERVKEILDKWDTISLDNQEREIFMHRIKTMPLTTLGPEYKEKAENILGYKQTINLGEHLGGPNITKVEAPKVTKEEKTSIWPFLFLILFIFIGIGLYLAYPYLGDIFEKIDTLIKGKEPQTEEPIPKDPELEPEEPTDPIVDTISSIEFLNKLMYPSNYKLSYNGSISMFVGVKLGRITSTIQTERNELIQSFTTMTMHTDGKETANIKSYTYLENGRLTLYSKAKNDKKWNRTFQDYIDNVPLFKNTLATYGKNEILKNVNTSEGTMYVLKVTIPIKYFKQFMINTYDNNFAFNNEKDVIITIQMNSKTNIIHKYDINYNECAISYDSNEISTFVETIQYYNIGKIKAINMPQEVLDNLAEE